tara:strand:- start:1353 stop:1979 length:627 start_codon:yes stop_codon:yes gene_type:complete
MKMYWDNYYRNKKKNTKASNFSQFFLKNFLDKNSVLLDIGTGDGRDAFFFHNKVKLIFAMDQSSVAIKNNNIKKNKLNLKNIFFKKMSINNLKYFKSKKIKYVYARFFLHAINRKKEDIFLNNLKKNFDSKTLIALEYRTIKDKLMKKGKKISKYERFTDHYRRFVDPKKFDEKIKKRNFKIIYKKQGINLSKTPKDNPYLCRIVFRI